MSKDIIRSEYHAPGPMEAGTAHVPEELTLRDLTRVVWSRRWLIAGTVAAATLFAFAATSFQQPQYESEATVRLYSDASARSRFGSELGALTGLTGLGRTGSGIETDVWVIQSRRILAPVVDSLNLYVRMESPYVPRSDVFSSLAVTSEPLPVLVELDRRGDSYAVSVEHDPALRVDYPDAVRPGAPATIAGIQFHLRPDIAYDEIVFRIRSPQQAVEDVQRNIEVEQLGRNSEILAVRYRAPDRELAASVPNFLAQEFMAYKLRSTQSDAARRAGFLRQQVERYDAELAAAEERLREFREREHIVSVEDQAAAQVRRMAELQARHDELLEERNALDGLLARLEVGSEDRDTERYRSLAAFPVFFRNATIQAMLTSLIELENQRSELAVLRTPNSIDIRGIDARIAELENQLLSTVQSYRASLESQLASLSGTLREYMGRAGTVPAREVEYARLLRQQKLLTDIHSQLVLTLRETEVEEAVEPLQIELLDPAIKPLRASAPRPLLNALIGGVLGLMLALAAVFVRHAADTRVYSRRDVLLASGGIAVIGAIPHVNGGGSLIARTRLALPRHGRRVEPEPRPLVLLDAPRTPAAEAFRGLRTQLTTRLAASEQRVLVVTSAAEGEGKSTTAANLAITFAQQGVRTLLCDADLRKGKLHQLLNLQHAPGVSDILMGQGTVEECVQPVTVDGAALDVLTAGTSPTHPAELLGSNSTRELLAGLSEHYDRIIVDTPPLGLATDAAVIGSLPGTGTVLVTRAGFSDRRAIEQIAQEFRSLDIRVLGIIINDVQEDGVTYSAR